MFALNNNNNVYTAKRTYTYIPVDYVLQIVSVNRVQFLYYLSEV